MVARPGCLHQDQRGTCGVATTQFLHVSEDPHDFARVIDELTGPSGEARLRSGRTLKLMPESVREDQSGRRQVSRLYQDGLMNLVSELTYSNAFQYTVGSDPYVHRGAFVDEVGTFQQAGLSDDQVRLSLEAVTVRPVSSVPGEHLSTQAGQEAFELALDDARKRGSGLSVSMAWNNEGVHQRHAVAVLGFTEDRRVRVRNSQIEGWDTSGAYGGPTRGFSHLSGDDFFGGVSLMDREEFFERVQSYRVPTDPREALERKSQGEGPAELGFLIASTVRTSG